jgi:hypothetical protein
MTDVLLRYRFGTNLSGELGEHENDTRVAALRGAIKKSSFTFNYDEFCFRAYFERSSIRNRRVT